MRLMRSVLSAGLLMLVAMGALAQGTFTHYWNFDAAAAGVYEDGQPINLPLWGGSFGTFAQRLAPAVGVGPEIAVAPGGAPQGGNVLLCESGGFEEGMVVELVAAGLSSTEYTPDLTIEVMFRTTVANIAGNTVGLQNIICCDWPSEQWFQGTLRILGDGAGAGRPSDSEHIEFAAWFPAPSPNPNEVRVVSAATVVPDQWYHVAAIFDHNESDPSNSQIEMYIDGVSQGTAIYDAVDEVNSLEVDHAFAVFGDPATEHARSDPAWRYWIGCSSNRNISFTDNRGLDGEIDAVNVTNQVLDPGTFLLPDGPPTSGTMDWQMYR
jgi:concanavalin A-like lectin/glucanase superfamily protein